MKRMRNIYPFMAMIGHDRARLALTLLSVNPACGSLLIIGRQGTGKTAMVRGWGALLSSKRLVEVPLNVSSDRLIGGVDFEQALLGKEHVLCPGLLTEADGNVLFVDDINLHSDFVLQMIFEAHASGENKIQREGLSQTMKSHFVLVGVMNPDEGSMTSGMLQNFGMSVVVETEGEDRLAILRNQWEFETNVEKFYREVKDVEEAWKIQVRSAKERLRSVKVPSGCFLEIVQRCEEANVAGNTAEKILLETARTYAAWMNSDLVKSEHISVAASFVLPHRWRMRQDLSDISDSLPEEKESKEKRDKSGMQEENSDEKMERFEQGMFDSEDRTEVMNDLRSNVRIVGEKLKNRFVSPRGKRSKYRSIFGDGRYVDHEMFKKGSGTSIAFDATLREAVQHQSERKTRENCAVEIRVSDLKLKVLEERQNAVILFVVDASASMGAHKRMGAVKGAVMSMLRDVYRNRDEVGIIAFRKTGAEVLLPITRSPFLAKKRLENLSTGGKTPLAKGLDTAYRLLAARRIKKPGETQFLILLTDGRGNVSLEEFGDAAEDVRNITKKIAISPILFAVLDTETSFIRLEKAKEIARIGGGNYIHLEDISGEEIENIVLNIRKGK